MSNADTALEMMGVAEREPAPRKFMTFNGDRVAEAWARLYFGPTTQGRVFKVTHAEYDETADKTRVVLAPVADYELQQVLDAIQRAGR